MDKIDRAIDAITHNYYNNFICSYIFSSDV